MERISSIRDVEGRYDAVLCDVWGVIHDGQALYSGVAQTLTELRASGVVVVLVSNVPRPHAVVVDHLVEMGLPPSAWDGVVTSGDVIRVELARRSPGPMLVLGRDSDVGLWDGLGLERAPLGRARFVAIAGLSDADEQPEAYADVLAAARVRDLELLCANPDLQVQAGDRLVWCAGAVALQYARLGGRVVQAGKPHRAIYERALAAIAQVSHRQVAPERILAIGDGIGTDILGANRAGLASLFVATGMHGDSLLANGEVDLDRVTAALTPAGASATHVMTRLA